MTPLLLENELERGFFMSKYPSMTIEEFKQQNQTWGCWDAKNNNKIPLSPINKGKAETDNEELWTTYIRAAAYSKEKNLGGIGFRFSGNIVGIDIDHTDIPDRKILADAIYKCFKGTYIERSPSGNGFHIIALFDRSQLPSNYKSDYRQKHSKLGLECYIGGVTNRYFTFTEDVINAVSITDQTENILFFLDKYMKKDEVQIISKNQETLDEQKMPQPIQIAPRPPSYDSDDELIWRIENSKQGEKFKVLWYGNEWRKIYKRADNSGDHSGADAALCCILAWWTQGNADEIDRLFRLSPYYAQKDAKHLEKWERYDYRIERTINGAIAKCNGKFYQPRQTQNDVQIETEAEFLEMLLNGEKPKLKKLTFKAIKKELEERELTIGFNEILGQVEIQNFDAKNMNALELLTIELNESLKFKYSDASVDTITNYLRRIANENSVNPVLDLIQETSWSGVDRFELLYEVFNGDNLNDFDKTLIRKWFLQGAALLTNNIHKLLAPDGMLVLDGPQGIGKTTFFERVAMIKILGARYFRAGQKINKHDKDTLRRCLTTWIAEMGEIDSMPIPDIPDLKAFITNAFDSYRLPFGRSDNEFPRRANLCATVNTDIYKGGFLLDPTGNRRFWTVKLTAIDREKLNSLDFLDLWRQAYAIISADLYAYKLTSQDQAQLEDRNASNMKYIVGEVEIMDIIQNAIDNPNDYTWEHKTITEWKLLFDALKYIDSGRLGRALSAIRKRNPYYVQNGWLEIKKGKYERLIYLPVRAIVNNISPY